MLLESAIDPEEHAAYAFSLRKNTASKSSSGPNQKSQPKQDGGYRPYILSLSKTIDSLFHDLEENIPVSRISKARSERSIDSVVLGGGVFLNKHLLGRARSRLEEEGFYVLRSLNYSPNDEAISIGQIAYALYHLKKTYIQD